MSVSWLVDCGAVEFFLLWIAFGLNQQAVLIVVAATIIMTTAAVSKQSKASVYNNVSVLRG